jgi:hypothetical protein
MKIPYYEGLEIHTYDNPGWGIKYNFTKDDYNTEYWISFKEMSLIKFHKNNDFSDSNQQWSSATGDESKFTAAGGPLYLGVLLKVFEQWQSKQPIDPGELPVTLNLKDPKDMDNLEWLQWYYFDLCDGDWEHTYGIKIKAVEEEWTLSIDISDTVFEDFEYERIDTENYQCWLENRVFKGTGHKDKLDEIIGEFRRWMSVVNTKLGYVEVPLGDKYIDPWACE